jgi:hypothetical protein
MKHCFLVATLLLCPLVSSAAPGSLTVSPQIPKRPQQYVRRADFANGAHAEQVGTIFTITLRNGNRMTFNHVPNPSAPRPGVSCAQLKSWLDGHSAHTNKWRERCLK